MKLLFDQNISYRILKLLNEDFSECNSVKSLGLINSQDLEIWKFAKANGYTIVTQDSDFNELNGLFGFPPKIIWIRTGNLKTFAIAQILTNHHVELASFIENANYGCFEIMKLQ